MAEITPDQLQILRDRGLDDDKIGRLAESGMVPQFSRRYADEMKFESEQQAKEDEETASNIESYQEDLALKQERRDQAGIEGAPETIEAPPGLIAGPKSPFKLTGEEDPELQLVLAGGPQVSPMTPAEQDFMAENNLGKSENQMIAEQWQARENEQLDLIKNKYYADKKMGEDKAKISRAQAEYDSKMNERQMKLMDDRDSATKLYMDDTKRLEDEIAAAEVKPTDFWADMGSDKKMAAILAMAASTYAQNISGTMSDGNYVGQAIQGVIDQDVAKQKANYESKSDQLSRKTSAYSRAMAVTGDSVKAVEIAKGAAAKNTLNKMAVLEAEAAPGQAKLNMQQSMAMVKQKGLTAKVKMAQDYSAKVQELSIPGKPGWIADDEKSKTFMKEAIPKFETSMGTLDSMIGKIGDMNFLKSVTPSDLKQELETMATSLRGEARTDIVGPGAITEKEMELLKSAIPSGADAWTVVGRNRATARLNAVKSMIKRRFDADKKVHLRSGGGSSNRLGLKPKR